MYSSSAVLVVFASRRSEVAEGAQVAGTPPPPASCGREQILVETCSTHLSVPNREVVDTIVFFLTLSYVFTSTVLRPHYFPKSESLIRGGGGSGRMYLVGVFL